jgi:ABC-2 type transport system permease protein
MLGELSVLTLRELKKWLRTPFPALGLFIGPIVWVFIFGNALNAAFFSSGGASSTLEGAPNYFNFMASGMAVSMSLTYAARTGASLFTDRFTGYLDRLKISPATRSTIIMAKVLGGVILSLIQAGILLFMSAPLGLDLRYLSPASVALVLATFVLLSAGFCSVFLLVSLRTKRWQTQQLVGPLVVTPITFLSSVFYPATKLPPILQKLVLLNPLSYAADAARQLFFHPTPWLIPALQLDMLALGVFAAGASAALALAYRFWL